MVRGHFPLTYRITFWYITLAVTLSLIAEVVRLVRP